MVVQLQENSKINLLIKNLKTKKIKKLNYSKVIPFFIQAKKEIVSSKFKLIEDVNRYFVFYKLLLEVINSKILYKIYFIIKFRKKIDLKLKKFQFKNVKINLLNRINALYQKIDRSYLGT